MHYTAVIEVYRVEQENPAGTRGMDKNKQEVGRVVLRAKSPEDLRRMCQMGIDTMLYSEGPDVVACSHPNKIKCDKCDNMICTNCGAGHNIGVDHRLETPRDSKIL